MKYVFIIVRRSILVVLLVLLIPYYIQKFTNDMDRGIGGSIHALQEDGPVTKLPVHQSF
ncbi:hypothetical protein H8B09_11150 [Paenibacillus sp. PR3]|uniref:Uncharacterized protein n=1 Tax=Paenibacillus terricola TaxID=2763503 RepID=A0ABR8MWF7_9BACL|nr:hypothetical protein [Paenibacillus terricola]MBD3919312.1 hypothetical protein [Paenibacillus terricola]